ncbi:g11748 [Coccomyxa elongata]
MAKHFLVSLQHIRAGYIQTLVTSCFSHKDVMHLLANMFTLYFFWNRGFSGKLVYFLYICGGLAGNLASLAEEYYRIASSIKNPWARDVAIRRSPPALGASGSVNASVIFNILVSPQSTVLLYGIVPVPALLFGGLWIYYDIAGAMGGQQSPGPSGHFIGYTAHLGGATTGALTYLAYRRGLLRFVTR